MLNVPVVFLTSCMLIPVCYGDDAERKLLTNLFASYSATARPVQSSSDPVVVTFDIALRKVLEMDEKNQVLITSVWLRLYWQDYQLRWNMSQWSGISFISVSPDMIWRPDITLYNNVEKDFFGLDVTVQTKAAVYSTGDVAWLMPAVLRSDCKMNMLYFPFDTQACPLQFGSWIYDSQGIDLYPKRSTGDVSSFQLSDEFNLIGFDATRLSQIYGCCPNPYVTITYTIRLQRRTKYYLYNIVLPVALIAVMTALAHMLPHATGERVGLIITAFLSLSVYMLIVQDNVPISSEEIPLIIRLFTAILGQIVALLIANTLIIRCAYYDFDVPPVVDKVINGWLARIMLCRASRPDCKQTPQMSAKRDRPKDASTTQSLKIENRLTGLESCAKNLQVTNLTCSFEVTQTEYNKNKNNNNSNNNNNNNNSPHYLQSHATETNTDDFGDNPFTNGGHGRLLERVDSLLEIEKKREHSEARRAAWARISDVFDRMFFVSFLATISATVCVYLAEAPHVIV